MKPMQPMAPMKPMEPMKKPEAWWPKDLGEPSTSGGQNEMRYAFFSDSHRLLIEENGTVSTYDSGDDQIHGVSQQSGTQGPTFRSQRGTVHLADMKKL